MTEGLAMDGDGSSRFRARARGRLRRGAARASGALCLVATSVVSVIGLTASVASATGTSYQVITTLTDGNSFNGNNLPFGISTSGATSWLTNELDNSVTEINDATGTFANGTLGNSTFPVGSGPTGISFEGTHVWVANQGDHDVTELDADGSFADGTLAASSVPVFSNSPYDNVASDGTHVWVASSDSLGPDCGPYLTELDTSTGTAIAALPGEAVTFPLVASATVAPTKGSSAWFSAEGLPSGLTLAAGTGTKADTATIAGDAPSTPGVYRFDVRASNASGVQTTQAMGIDVLGFTSGATSATFTVGSHGSATVVVITHSMGNLAISAGIAAKLPPGVTFTDHGDGTATIAGTPSSTADRSDPYVLKITATEGKVKVSESFVLTVDQAAAISTATPSVTVKAGKAVSIELMTTGFPVPTVGLGSGAPSWLTASSTKLSGTTPNTGGSWTFTVSASNGVGGAATRTVTINALAITSASSTTFVHGEPGQTFTVTTAGAPPGSTMVVAGAIAEWYAFHDNGNGSGTMSGTPPAAQSRPDRLTITVTAGSVVVTQKFTLRVT
ncbi:MAG: putative Ig domain-containing protein [Acidimicrobiales bacterium]|jgi:hypothetical protein